MTNYEVYGAGFIIPIFLICAVSFLLFINIHTQISVSTVYTLNDRKLRIKTFVKVLSLAIFIFTITLLLFQVSSKVWIFKNAGKVNGIDINTQLYNAAQIVIPTIGVVITGIFSYLIYHSTEKTVNVTKDIYKVEEKRDKEKERDLLMEEIENYRTYLVTRINTLVDLENIIGEWEIRLKNSNSNGKLVAREMDKKHHNLFTAGQDIYDRYTKTYKSVRINLILNAFKDEEVKEIKSLEKDLNELKLASLDLYKKYFSINKELSYAHKKLLRKIREG